ncbi:hypothetical protein [Nonomuraea soli]|uniref:Uncharacterized protein n=1 Tax=Nonomuraea soli TaxID=1032476 RepID=A0A7W0CJI2_9ACTN|nr:hypothetical protein [Nonomuraea soli]MBA2892097.1 hypothetical protein [Nonomuraea soli]
MTFLAATATTDPATNIATLLPLAGILAVTLWALGYAAACATSPFARCNRCGGRGKTLTARGHLKRFCRRCKGTGLRLRWGRRLFNALHHFFGAAR